MFSHTRDGECLNLRDPTSRFAAKYRGISSEYIDEYLTQRNIGKKKELRELRRKIVFLIITMFGQICFNLKI